MLDNFHELGYNSRNFRKKARKQESTLFGKQQRDRTE